MNQNDTIAIFIRDVKQILAADLNQGTDLERVAERMRKLVTDPIIRNWQEEPIGTNPAGKPRLYFDPAQGIAYTSQPR